MTRARANLRVHPAPLLPQPGPTAPRALAHGLQPRREHYKDEALPAQLLQKIVESCADEDVVHDRGEPRLDERTREQARVPQSESQLTRRLRRHLPPFRPPPA